MSKTLMATCDRCTATYEFHPQHAGYRIQRFGPAPDPGYDQMMMDVDLCDACHLLLREWVENRQDGE